MANFYDVINGIFRNTYILFQRELWAAGRQFVWYRYITYLIVHTFRSRYEDNKGEAEAQLNVDLIVDVVRLEILQTDEDEEGEEETEES